MPGLKSTAPAAGVCWPAPMSRYADVPDLPPDSVKAPTPAPSAAARLTVKFPVAGATQGVVPVP